MSKGMTSPDIAGQRFGLWVVLRRAAHHDGSKSAHWDCMCDCGTRRDVDGGRLRGGQSLSCGCDKGRRIGEAKLTHGKYGTRTYRIWQHLRNRCNRPSNKDYARYGGRGITVCDRWSRFENFLADMGEAPTDLTIERVDNDGPYTKGNCVWATQIEQGSNKRNNHRIEFGGRSLTVSEWAREMGVQPGTLFARLRRPGWTAARALTTPIR